ncbi:MAG: 5-formyltetrahydrofolate cyclo-ligase [Actinomycetaceae bacterium]|nr:5-formyltetrahydrofolate cyclo-ligase [Actinomycetaceae bacterium]
MQSLNNGIDALEEEELENRKGALRKQLRKDREQISACTRTEYSAKMVATAMTLVRQCDCFAAYVPVNKEPDVLPLLNRAFAMEKRILLPRLGPKLTRSWSVFAGEDDLSVHAPGRPPAPSGPVLEPEALAEASLAFIPALAIDYMGNRLGQGGGWYDRALCHISPDALLVGMVYDREFWREKTVPTGPYDRRVNAVITNMGLFELNGKPTSVFHLTER